MFIISTNSYEARFLYKVIEDKTTTSAQVLSIPRGLNEFREVFTSTDNDKVDQFEGSSVVMFIYPISGQFILYLFSPGMVVLGCDPGVVNSATMVGGVCQQDDSGRLRVPHTRTFKFNARLIWERSKITSRKNKNKKLAKKNVCKFHHTNSKHPCYLSTDVECNHHLGRMNWLFSDHGRGNNNYKIYLEEHVKFCYLDHDFTTLCMRKKTLEWVVSQVCSKKWCDGTHNKKRHVIVLWGNGFMHGCMRGNSAPHASQLYRAFKARE